jgi:hypothetical protein
MDAIQNLLHLICRAMKACPEQYPKLLQPTGTIDSGRAYAIIDNKLKEMGDVEHEIYIPDLDNKVYNKDDVSSFHGLEEVASILYIIETHDCDDFARELFGKGIGLIWSDKHAFNYFIDNMDNIWFIEPQNKQMSQEVQVWQGRDIRFFLGA